MQLIIKTNPLRLMASQFIYLHPVKHGKFVLTGRYECHSDDYGLMGDVKCLGLFEYPLHQITENIIMLSEADTLYRQKLEERYVFRSDIIQVARFRFETRNNEAFTTMLRMEMNRIGLQFSFQTPLFN